MENNKNKKSVKFQGDMLNFCDFIQVFVFTRNHHLNKSKYIIISILFYFIYFFNLIFLFTFLRRQYYCYKVAGFLPVIFGRSKFPKIPLEKKFLESLTVANIFFSNQCCINQWQSVYETEA